MAITFNSKYNRFVIDLDANTVTEELQLGNWDEAYITINALAGGASVTTKVAGTAVALRTSTITESFGCSAPNLSFSLSGTSAQIIVDLKEK